MAYFLADQLSGVIQAELIKQLICVLTDEGMTVHGVVCMTPCRRVCTAQCVYVAAQRLRAPIYPLSL